MNWVGRVCQSKIGKGWKGAERISSGTTHLVNSSFHGEANVPVAMGIE